MTKKLRANEEVLAELHARVASSLMAYLDDEENGLAYLNAAIRFLKDNQIKADLNFNSTVKQIQEKVEDVRSLPFDVKDEDE